MPLLQNHSQPVNSTDLQPSDSADSDEKSKVKHTFDLVSWAVVTCGPLNIIMAYCWPAVGLWTIFLTSLNIGFLACYPQLSCHEDSGTH